MKKLERKEMKNLIGGLVAPYPGSIWGQCSATATCRDGSTITLSCEGWNVKCTASDYGTSNGGGTWSPSNGSTYCSTTNTPGAVSSLTFKNCDGTGF